MEHIANITIYNNEGFHFDTGHRYLITLRPHAAVIEYQDLMYTDQPESSPFVRTSMTSSRFFWNSWKQVWAHRPHITRSLTHPQDIKIGDTLWTLPITMSPGM